MAQEKPNGYVNKLHLIYVTICLSITILAVLTITIWHKESASVGLNNAATAASIVLAVVAIVITLVDVAGQRNIVLELKESTEKMDHTLASASERLDEVNTLKDDLLNAINNISKHNNDVMSYLKELLEKSEESNDKTVQKEELEKLYSMIKHSYFDNYNSVSYNEKINYLNKKANSHFIKKLVSDSFNVGELFTIKKLQNIFLNSEGYKVPQELILQFLEREMNSGNIDRVNGNEYRTNLEFYKDLV